MTPDQTKAFEEKIYAFIGREMAPPTKGHDDVNEAMIRHWCEVIGDENPVYTNKAFAEQSSKKGIIAPPAMMQSWSMEGYPMALNPPLDVQRQLHNVFDEHGFTGVLGTNCKQEYFQDVHVGDSVIAHTVIDTISEQKATQRGIGYFVETVTNFTNQRNEAVAKMVFRVLKFIPNEPIKPVSEGTDDTPKAATRIASPRGQDNKWWWDAVDNGKCLIQRCSCCGTLRHPPRPMCGECQSTEWDSIESRLEGEVYSFVEMHYPKFPGYEYPLLCAVIDLKEGTRLISNLVGIKPEAVKIGMKVQGKVEQVDPDTMLPQFYPVEL